MLIRLFAMLNASLNMCTLVKFIIQNVGCFFISSTKHSSVFLYHTAECV